VLRGWLREHSPAELGRVVMLAPPNRGSEVVDALADIPLLAGVLGPTGVGLGTGTQAITARLGRVTFELGVIAGNSSVNPLFSWLIPGDDDGAVAVERTRVEGMRDFLVLNHTHTFIMNSPEVHTQVAAFLETGAFQR